MSNTKRNHYLPRTYLKHFLNENDNLFVYKKGEKFFNNETDYHDRLLTIMGEPALLNWGVENGLYHAEGLSDMNSVEDFFTSEIDDHYDYLLDLVENKKTDKSDFESGLRFLIATMLVRTPHFKVLVEEVVGAFRRQELKWFVEDSDLVEKFKQYHEKKRGKKLDKGKLDKFRDIIKNDKYDIKHPNALYLSNAFNFLLKCDEIFSVMNLVVLEARGKGFFITSDSPVVYFVPRDKTNFYISPKNLKSPFVELFFPMSKKHCIYMSYKRGFKKYQLIDREDCRRIANYNISINSFDYIYTPYEAKYLDKFIKEYTPYPIKFTIS